MHWAIVCVTYQTSPGGVKPTSSHTQSSPNCTAEGEVVGQQFSPHTHNIPTHTAEGAAAACSGAEGEGGKGAAGEGAAAGCSSGGCTCTRSTCGACSGCRERWVHMHTKHWVHMHMQHMRCMQWMHGALGAHAHAAHACSKVGCTSTLQ